MAAAAGYTHAASPSGELCILRPVFLHCFAALSQIFEVGPTEVLMLLHVEPKV